MVPRLSEYLRKEVDIDSINQSNFFNVMKLRLNIPPEERDEEDLEILKACTKHLEFFANIINVDPEDKLLAFYNGCKYLRYKF